MDIKISKTYKITGITQKEFDIIYAGLCCLHEKEAQYYNEDITDSDIRKLALNFSYDASCPLMSHEFKWEG